MGCDFCGVTRFNGSHFRRRPIDEIVEEWNATTRKFLFVVDDNFFGVSRADADWAKELLRALIARGKRRLWFSQTTVNMGGDREALRLAYRAGCRGMLVGFETFNPANLKQYHKGLNAKLLDDYRRLVDGFHAAAHRGHGRLHRRRAMTTPRIPSPTRPWRRSSSGWTSSR